MSVCQWYGEPATTHLADQLSSKYLIYGNYNVHITLNKAGGDFSDYYYVSYHGNCCVVYGVKYSPLGSRSVQTSEKIERAVK